MSYVMSYVLVGVVCFAGGGLAAFFLQGKILQGINEVKAIVNDVHAKVDNVIAAVKK